MTPPPSRDEPAGSDLYRPEALEAWHRPRPEPPVETHRPPSPLGTIGIVAAVFVGFVWLLFVVPWPRYSRWPAALVAGDHGCRVRAFVPRPRAAAVAEASRYRYLGDDGTVLDGLAVGAAGSADQGRVVFEAVVPCLALAGAPASGRLEAAYPSAPLLRRGPAPEAGR
jgi:hypothetical protein